MEIIFSAVPLGEIERMNNFDERDSAQLSTENSIIIIIVCLQGRSRADPLAVSLADLDEMARVLVDDITY